MIISEKTVTFSRDSWEELYNNDYYREVLEAIEDRESLRDAKIKADEFISFREYDRNRMQKSDV